MQVEYNNNKKNKHNIKLLNKWCGWRKYNFLRNVNLEIYNK